MISNCQNSADLSCSSFVLWWILRHGHSMWSKRISLHQVPMDLTSISWAAASWETCAVKTWHLSGDSWREFNSRLHVNCLAHLLCNPPSTSSVLPLSLSLLLSILFCTCAVQPLCDLYNVWTAYQLIFDTRSNQQRNQHIGIACSSPFTWKAQGLETSQTSVKEENNSTHSKTPEAFLSRQCDKRKRLHSSLPLKSWSLLGRSTGPISAVTRISEHWALSAHVCAGQSLRINPQIQQTR
jgi:hypothetical protein